MKEGEINPLFSSFLYYKFLDTDIEKIRKYCYDLRDKDNGRNIFQQRRINWSTLNLGNYARTQI